MTPIPVETVENKVDELEENGKAMKRKEATEVDESSVKAESDAGDEDRDENGKQVQPNRGQRRPIVLERFVKGYVKWFSMSRGLLFTFLTRTSIFFKAMDSSTLTTETKKCLSTPLQLSVR